MTRLEVTISNSLKKKSSGAYRLFFDTQDDHFNNSHVKTFSCQLASPCKALGFDTILTMLIKITYLENQMANFITLIEW